MTERRALTIGGVALLGIVIGWVLFVGVPRWYTARATRTVAASPAPIAPPPPGRKIKAHLYYVADDGLRLTSVERDIAYGEGTLAQAREIVAAQIAPVAEPLVSAVPTGTRLRALFVSERGEAFVDLSREIVAAHPGGTVDELLTIYTIVNTLTVNLPAITSVQVLVDGKEVDTLAGHIDLRRPLAKNLTWVQ